MIDVLLAPSQPADSKARALWSGAWDVLTWETERWGEIHAHLRANALALRLATLLHDVGKPGTRTVEADGRTRFFGHAELGARLATEALEALRLPSAVQERVALLVDQHLRPGQIASPGEPPTSAALHRFHRALGDATPDVCFLFLADSLATVGADRLLPRWPAYVAHVHRIVTWRPPADSAAVRRLVDGHAVMRATGFPPGPRIGRIIAALDEAAATGEVSSMEQALDLARRLALELPEE
jgi:putative nucleotidyltransferase with HDIG domain